MLITLLLYFMSSAIFFLADFKLRETPTETVGSEFVCFFFTAFFRGLTHSYMCSKILSHSKEQVSILKIVIVCTYLAALILTWQFFTSTS